MSLTHGITHNRRQGFMGMQLSSSAGLRVGVRHCPLSATAYPVFDDAKERSVP
jgi:hypothetical protein